MTAPPAFPVIGFAAWSGTGKTTLLARLIPWFKAHGVRVAAVKATHHDFDIDRPDKDSDILRKVGVTQVLLVSAGRTALIVEHEPAAAPDLARLDAAGADLVLVEGFRHAPFPKIELHRPALGKPRLYPQDASIVAIAADAALPEPPAIPVLDLNDVAAVGEFVLGYFGSSIRPKSFSAPASCT